MSGMTKKAGIPRIGPFWFVPHEDGGSCLEGLGVLASEIPAIAGFRTVETGHADFWPEVVRRHRRLWGSSYDEYPRGRVNYLVDDDLYLLLADRQLLERPFIDAVIESWELPRDRLATASDPHYRSRRAVPLPRLIGWDEGASR